MKLFESTPISRLTAVAALTLLLAACGGGSGGVDDGADDGNGDGVGIDPSTLDPAGDHDNDDIPNDRDVDLTNGDDDNFDGVDDFFQTDDITDGGDSTDGTDNTNACGAGGSDFDSSTADWSDNCVISRNGPHKQSNYTRGIQRVLNCLGHAVRDDADFGPNTESAVMAFQTENPPATVDGIVGPETWGFLQDRLASQVFDTSTDSFFVDNYDPDGDNVVNSICFGETLFYQAVDAATGVGGSWEMAKTINSLDRIPFSIGLDAVE